MSMWIGKVYQQVTKVAMLMYRHCIAPGLFTFAYPVINYVCLTVKAMFVVTMVSGAIYHSILFHAGVTQRPVNNIIASSHGRSICQHSEQSRDADERSR